MKKLTLLASFILSVSAFAQVSFQDVSFNEALSKAKSESKLIFLQVASPSCRECNTVAEKGLSDNNISQLVNQNFLPVLISAKHASRRQVETAYNLPDGFGTLFIDGNGTLIHKYAGSTTRWQHYKEQIDIALYRAGETVKVSALENEYRNGNKSIGLLEQLLLKKQSLNLNTANLVDEYVSLLPADSLGSIHTLQFIASMMPLYRSAAFTALRKDPALFNSAWYALPAGKRSAINSGIIHHSLNKAINDKDESYAFQVAAFARSTYPNGGIASIKAYGTQMLEFYERTDDTAKYLATAIRHYDLVAKTTNADSIRKVDSAMTKQALGVAKKDTMKTADGYRVTASVRYSPMAQRYTWELKEGAWNVYKRTNDPEMLAKATLWIEKALSMMETHEALDVYARLLYKQHQKEKAIDIQGKAVEMKKKRGYSTSDYEEALTQMQNGLALTN